MTLYEAYVEAWLDWAGADDASDWDTTIADGFVSAPTTPDQRPNTSR